MARLAVGSALVGHEGELLAFAGSRADFDARRFAATVAYDSPYVAIYAAYDIFRENGCELEKTSVVSLPDAPRSPCPSRAGW